MGVFFSNDESQGSSNTGSLLDHSVDLTPSKKAFSALEVLRPEDRAKAAIIGAFVADSLSASSSKSDDNGSNEGDLISDTSTIETSHSWHSGHQSHYGEDAFPFLQLISTRGYFESIDACEDAFQYLSILKEKDTRHCNVHPLTKEFFDRRMEGYPWEECSSRDDVNFLSIAKVPILVARYAGSPNLLDKVEDAVRIYQTHPKVIAACRLSARLLERVVLGHTVADTLRWAIALPEATEPDTSSKFLTEKLVSSYSRRQLSSFRSDGGFGNSAVTLGKHEREFLSSILPVPAPAVIVPLKSYGSCLSTGTAIEEVSKGSKIQSNDLPEHCNSAYNGRSGIESTGYSDSGCVNAAGAINHYYTCNRTNGAKHSRQGDDCSVMTAPTRAVPHHSRATNAVGSAHSRARSVPFSLAVEEIGMSAKLPECLQASLYGLNIFHSYSSAVRANTMSGGDSTCRSWLIGDLLYALPDPSPNFTRHSGAMLAAEHGEMSIPADWYDQTLLNSQISTMAGRLVGSNPYFETLKEKGCHLSVLLM